MGLTVGAERVVALLMGILESIKQVAHVVVIDLHPTKTSSVSASACAAARSDSP